MYTYIYIYIYVYIYMYMYIYIYTQLIFSRAIHQGPGTFIACQINSERGDLLRYLLRKLVEVDCCESDLFL